MKKSFRNLLVVAAVLTMYACGEKETTAGHLVLKLALEEQEVSIHDVFSNQKFVL